MQKILPLYSGVPEKMNWVGFGSGSGTNLRECAKVMPPVAVFSDKPNAKLFSLDELAQNLGIIHHSMNGYQACGSWRKAKGDHVLRAEYKKRSIEFNNEIVRWLYEVEQKKGERIDLIVLGGYMRIIEEPLLEAYKDRIINVHPADLSRLFLINNPPERMYIGDDAVLRVVRIREPYTCSSVIMVDSGVDHGEILVQGPKHIVTYSELFEAEGKVSPEVLREMEVSFASSLQDRQKVISDHPAFTTALKMISEGRIAIGSEKTFYNEWRQVFVDGQPMPYEGFQVKK